MQAGVPVVPIVIQNSSDSMPKSAVLIRPARISVEVLPPVNTDNWKAETVDEHVAQIRQMFLEKLGQAKNREVKLRRVK
jgi:putative phosphoserine phosphatase/1-acylglycerol-3-phosphate O-acyltransferase